MYLCVLSAMPALLAFTGCTKEEETIIMQIPIADTTPAVPNNTPVDTTLKTYLALGDSYTIGQSVLPAARFPAQTVELLRQSNINIKDPLYKATTGWTTIDLMAAINAASLKPPYDAVSLLIGVNDQYQTRDTTNYRARFTQLLNKSILLAGNRPSRVFVLSIPDYSVTPFVSASLKGQISREIDQFNAINRQVTERKNVAYIDITPGSREGATNALLIAHDNLHPSGTEYSKWAASLAFKMKAVLQ